ncbi:hypothetical protein K438DRAFT_2019304 [Mycena galopus ATCC 62051]|nr:hypothetical protein K438DRAFT_2019304 [Mycena galopus ATCC 62051]
MEEDYEEEAYSIYRHPAVQVSVHSVEYPPIGLDLNTPGSGWADILARARRSHGRMQVHIMRVPEGRSARFWAIPLRTADSRVHELIHRFATKTIRRNDEFIQELEAIWEGDDHVEIY